MSEPIDCRSEKGVTIGLIDSIISICRVLRHRDLSDDDVQEALKDLGQDADIDFILCKANY